MGFINIFTFSLQQFFLWLWHTRWGTSWPTLVLGKLLFHSLTQSKLWSPFSLLYSLPCFLLRWGVLPQIFFSSFHLEILLADSMALRYNFEKWKMRLDSCNGLLPVLMSYSGLKMSRYLVEMQFTGFAWINIFKTVNNWHARTHTHTQTSICSWSEDQMVKNSGPKQSSILITTIHITILKPKKYK